MARQIILVVRSQSELSASTKARIEEHFAKHPELRGEIHTMLLSDLNKQYNRAPQDNQGVTPSTMPKDDGNNDNKMDWEATGGSSKIPLATFMNDNPALRLGFDIKLSTPYQRLRREIETLRGLMPPAQGIKIKLNSQRQPAQKIKLKLVARRQQDHPKPKIKLFTKEQRIIKNRIQKEKEKREIVQRNIAAGSDTNYTKIKEEELEPNQGITITEDFIRPSIDLGYTIEPATYKYPIGPDWSLEDPALRPWATHQDKEWNAYELFTLRLTIRGEHLLDPSDQERNRYYKSAKE